tara:strand:- start:317 stop:730 length:414 start_codon:yes stop_codon:yes gene_type:complete
MKLTNKEIRQIIKEEIQSVLNEYVAKKLRERAKQVNYAGAQFEVVPLTDSELEDSNPKDMEPQENYAGAYSVKYIEDAEEEHLYNELKGSAFTDQELQGFNIDPNGSVNFVVIINDPDENKEKEIYDKIKNFLTFKS